MKRLLSSLVRLAKTETRKSSYRPALENLEDRWCPAATIGFANGVLTVTGDNNANNVQIVQNDDSNQLTVSADGATQVFDSDDVTKVAINLLGGDDQLTYKLGGGGDFEEAKDIQIDLGAGNDKATLDFANDGAGGLAEIDDNLNINVLGQAGNDQLDAFFGKVDGVNLTLAGNLGFGDDKFFAELKGDLTGDAQAVINMQDVNDLVAPLINRVLLAGGKDQFTVRASADVNIANDARLDVTLRTFDGNDNVQVQYQGELDGALKVQVATDDGADLAIALITLDQGSAGTVQAKVDGGGDNDIIALKIFDNSGNAAILQALLDGGAGDNDACVRTGNVIDANCETVVVQ